jgi:hypothetical protein
VHSVKNSELTAWASKPWDNETDRLDAYRDPRYKSGNADFIRAIEGKEMAGLLTTPPEAHEDHYTPSPVTDEEAAKIAKAEAEWQDNPATGGVVRRDDGDDGESAPPASGAFCSVRLPSY